jgi:hypothetical protein
MAKPNKTVAAFRAKRGRDPKAVAAAEARMAADPMVADMAKFQRGEMTAEEFQTKWSPFKEGEPTA